MILLRHKPVKTGLRAPQLRVMAARTSPHLKLNTLTLNALILNTLNQSTLRAALKRLLELGQ